MVLSSRLSARLTKSPGPFIDTCNSLTSPKSRLSPRPALMAALVITVIKAERIMGMFPSGDEGDGALWKALRRGNRHPGSVDVRNETPSAGPISVVFGAEGVAKQALLSLNASEQDSERQHGDDDAHP